MTTEYMTDYEVSLIPGVLGCAGSAEPTGLVWCDTTEKSIRTMPDYTGLCRMKCVKALRNGALSGSGHNHAGRL